jgi:hypothetical protein
MTHDAGAKSPARSSFPLSCHPQKLRAYSLREPRLTNNTSDQKANEEIQFLTCWTSTCGEADAGMPGCRTPIRSKGKQQIGAVFYRIRSIETQTAVERGLQWIGKLFISRSRPPHLLRLYLAPSIPTTIRIRSLFQQYGAHPCPSSSFLWAATHSIQCSFWLAISTPQPRHTRQKTAGHLHHNRRPPLPRRTRTCDPTSRALLGPCRSADRGWKNHHREDWQAQVRDG